MAIRISSILLAALLGLLSLCPTAMAYTCGKLIIKALLNEGYITSHKDCSDADVEILTNAIASAYIVPSLGRRGLRTTPQQHRELKLACASVCDGQLYSTCFFYSDIDCRSHARLNCRSGTCDRLLQEQQEQDVTFLMLDDIFNGDDTPILTGGGDRKLQTNTTCGITEEECILGKAKLYQAILSALGDVGTKCANLVVSPSLLQCMVPLAE